MKAWIFLHNSGDGKVGHLTAQALAQLRASHPHVHVDALGIDGLWERLVALPAAVVADLFNIASPPDGPESKVRVLLKRAGDLDDQCKRREAFGALEEALAVAELNRLPALQAEILVSMCLTSNTSEKKSR